MLTASRVRRGIRLSPAAAWCESVQARMGWVGVAEQIGRSVVPIGRSIRSESSAALGRVQPAQVSLCDDYEQPTARRESENFSLKNARSTVTSLPAMQERLYRAAADTSLGLSSGRSDSRRAPASVPVLGHETSMAKHPNKCQMPPPPATLRARMRSRATSSQSVVLTRAARSPTNRPSSGRSMERRLRRMNTRPCSYYSNEFRKEHRHFAARGHGVPVSRGVFVCPNTSWRVPRRRVLQRTEVAHTRIAPIARRLVP